MRQGTRTVCLALPFLVILASLVCLVLAFLGNRTRTSSIETSLYFLRVNTSDFTVAGTAVTTLTNISDWYTVGLWNYCEGDSSSDTPTFCSPPQQSFYFNPVEVWGLNQTSLVDALLPEAWTDGLKTYKAIARWLFIAYIIAISAAAATIILSFFAFCSRIGSIFTSVASVFLTLFALAASITATVLYSTLMGVIKEKVGSYGVHSELGHNMFIVTWLAAAFATVGGLWYSLTMCCCGVDHTSRKAQKPASGRPGWGFLRRATANQHGDAYERVPSPYVGTHQGANGYGQPVGGHGQGYGHGGSAWPLQSKTHDTSNAYEPYTRDGRA